MPVVLIVIDHEQAGRRLARKLGRQTFEARRRLLHPAKVFGVRPLQLRRHLRDGVGKIGTRHHVFGFFTEAIFRELFEHGYQIPRALNDGPDAAKPRGFLIAVILESLSNQLGVTDQMIQRRSQIMPVFLNEIVHLPKVIIAVTLRQLHFQSKKFT